MYLAKCIGIEDMFDWSNESLEMVRQLNVLAYDNLKVTFKGKTLGLDGVVKLGQEKLIVTEWPNLENDEDLKYLQNQIKLYMEKKGKGELKLNNRLKPKCKRILESILYKLFEKKMRVTFTSSMRLFIESAPIHRKFKKEFKPIIEEASRNLKQEEYLYINSRKIQGWVDNNKYEYKGDVMIELDYKVYETLVDHIKSLNEDLKKLKDKCDPKKKNIK